MILRRRRLLATGAAATLVPAGAGARAEGLGAPALALDFAGPQLPAGVSFARPSPAHGSLLGGALRRVQAGEPRFERDPAGTALGLLIEGETASLLASGVELGKWKTTGAASVAREPQVIAPDGTRGVFRIRAGENTKVDQGVLQWSGKAPGEAFLTASIYLRTPPGEPETPWALACFDWASYRQHSEVATIGERWTRLTASFPWYAFDKSSKVVNVAAPLPGATSGTRAILAWGAQYERSRFATTLAPAADEGTRRAADIVLADLSALSGPEGTLALELPAGVNPGGALLDAGPVFLAIDDNGRVEGRVGRLRLAGLGDAAGDRHFEISWWADGAAIRSGEREASIVRARASGSPGPVAPVSRSRLLNDAAGARPANAHLRRLVGWKRARPAAAPEAPAYAPKLYVVAFADDFDDPDVSRINENATPTGRAPAWRSRYRHGRFEVINQEKQIYVDAAFRGTSPAPLGVQPFAIRNSVLTITADRADPQRVRPFIKNFAYTSGALTTELSFSQRFGYFEIRCRCPLGKGFWPAFWLLPRRVAWPPEIDPLEASGERRWSFHQGAVGDKAHPGPWIDGVVDVTSAFHVYAVEWTARDLIYTVNGRETFRQPNFVDEPMYLLANLALGSRDPKWIPDPDATTPFPGRFEIDWIRAWRRDS